MEKIYTSQDYPGHEGSLATFGASVARPEALELLPLPNLMARMQAGEWRKAIEALRKQSNPKLQKEMKQRLPYFVYGVVEGRREEANVRQANGIVFDLDHLSDEEIARIKDLLPAKFPFARWIFRSPVDGLKIVVPFERPVAGKAHYAFVWEILAEELACASGHQPDNTPDLCRACFVSWDEDFRAVDGACGFDPFAFVPDQKENADLQEKEDFEDGDFPQTDADCFPQIGAEKKADTTADKNDQIPEAAHANSQIRANPRFLSAEICGNQTDLTELSVRSAVGHLCQCEMDWRDWSRCGIALYNHFGDRGREYWLRFAQNPHYGDTPEALAKHWERLKKYPGVNIATLFYIAERYGWINAIGNSTQIDTDNFPQIDTEKKADAAAEKNDQIPEAAHANSQNREDPRFLSAEICGKQSFPANSSNSRNSWTPTLKDFPELLELFGRPSNVPLDRSSLPQEINRYLDLVGRVTDAQDGAKLTAFLPVVAANIGNRVYMQNAGTRHYCNIWAAIIGPSTVSRKTTVINQAMKMLQPFKETLRELSPKERNEQDLELCRVTQARLYNLLGINPNRLLLHMELSAWMQEMNKAYNAGMKQEITDMFDGKDRNIAKMEIDEYISRPAFSIIGATTEDWFYRELREVADQRGGFLQRFIICIIQNIDVDTLRLEASDDPGCDRELHAWDEPLGVFRSLPDSHRLYASEEALELRNGIYADLMKRIALNANDPQAAYCARIFDNYFWRFCILIFLLKNWQDLRDARDALRLQSWFLANRVDEQTAQEAWYLCEYYYANTQPFLRSLSDNGKLDTEKKILRILQKAPGQSLTHSRLLCKSKLNSREFRVCVESLLERQAMIMNENYIGYRNRVCCEYILNPVLAGVDLN